MRKSALRGDVVPAGDPLSILLKGEGDTVLDAVLKTFLTDDKGNMYSSCRAIISCCIFLL